MKKILLIILSFILMLTSSLTAFGVTEPEYPFERYKLELSKEELLFIKELQKTTIDVASYSSSQSNVFMLEDIAKTFGLNINFIEYKNFGEALDAVSSGEVKLMSQVTYAREREEMVSFSRATTIMHAQIFANDFRIFDNAEYPVIGVETGTIWKDFMESAYPNISTVEFFDIDEAIKLLNDNTIDGVISGDKFYRKFVLAGKYPVEIKNRLDISATSIVGTKDEMELLLSAISKYTRTTYFEDAVSNFYTDYYKTSNEIYLNQLLEENNINDTIKVAVNIMPPFTDKVRGKYVGILPDLFTEAMKASGLAFEFVEVTDSSLVDVVELLESGKVDVVIPAFDTPSTRDDLIFSAERYEEKSLIVKRKNYDKKVFNEISDLSYEKIGFVKGSVYEDYFTNAFPLKDFTLYENETDLIAGLKNNEVDIIPIYERTFLEYINVTNDFSIEKNNNIPSFLSIDVAIASKNDESGKELMDIIDAALRTLDTSEIVSNYYNPMDYELYYKSQKQTFDLIISTLIIILIMTILLIIKLYRLSRTDNLCKIYNREALVKDFSKGIKENETIIFFDINKFKEFNDLYGHRVGDEVLKIFVNSYNGEESFRMYRLGGDEFLVIDDFSKKNISVAEYVDLFLYQNIHSKIADCDFSITSSIGILPGKYGIKDLEESLAIVDIAMYEAKRLQISKTFINKEKLDEYKNMVTFRKQLRQAIIHKDLYVNYQPIFNLETNKIEGVEVFSRWTLNENIVPTSTYMNLAKLLGVETEIDFISLDGCGKLYKALKDKNILPENFKIHINIADLTIRQLAREAQSIVDFGIPKEALILEIKESLLHNEKCKEYVITLIEKGYDVSIDNFLSSNSSPKNINNHLITSVKVDGSMLSNNNDIKLFIKSQVDMLTTLHKDVAVQTIEEKWQLNFFKSLGVKQGQGYYFCKPLDFEETCTYIENLLKTNQE